MSDEKQVRQQILTALQSKILPALASGREVGLLLAEPPLVTPPGVRVLGYRPALPDAPRLKPPSVHQCIWRKQGMDAARYIGLGFILDGEADFPFGTNIDRPLKANEGPESDFIQVVTIPSQTLFLLPPGVPRPSGGQPHWERPDRARAYSRIFWALVMPSAAFCHICRTQGETHDSAGVLTINDERLEPLAQLMQEEMRGRSPRFESVALSLARAIMLRLERALTTQPILPGRQLPLYPLPLPEASVPVRSVCQFIQIHRSEPLTLKEIAASHFLSPSQLNRRLQAEIGMSAMEYLTHCRVMTAKGLLANQELGELSLQEIGTLIGFADVSYFRRVFTHHVGQSPTDFRKQARADTLTQTTDS